MNFRPGGDDLQASSDNSLHINGGYIHIDASGDGLDVNGPVTMTGGTVIVSGPTSNGNGNGNGALDYTGSFKITGGFLVAAGSAGMAQAPDRTSTQASFMVNFETAQPATSLFHIESADGTDILTFSPAKEYQSLVLSSPELVMGADYSAYTGGSCSGDKACGLYTGGTYTAGAFMESFTISGTVTVIGAENRGMGGFPGGPLGIPGARPGR